METEEKSNSSSTAQPVAYDSQGRPLYLHPQENSDTFQTPTSDNKQSAIGQRSSHVTTRPESIPGQNFDPRLRSQYANPSRVVHATRDIEPKKFEISPELAAKHEQSKIEYPFLNLSYGEYVILNIKRNPIGAILPVVVTVLLVVAISGFTAAYPSIIHNYTLTFLPDPVAFATVAILLVLIVVLGGAAALWIYLQNQFFLTNESVIQEVQESLIARHEQTISLGSIEDASFRQSGIIQTLLNYGTIRLRTDGGETTYIFQYVTRPKHQIAMLNNAIEAFKNGRQVPDNIEG